MAARSKLDKASAVAVVCAILTAGAFRAHAQSLNPPASKPTLIVWAHTNLENQGAPTLDIVDVERYFVNVLAEHDVKNVVASSTTTTPRPLAPNTCVLELSVDAIQAAERPRWSYRNWRYESGTVFGVDLSLAVKELTSGKVLATLRSRAEQRFDPPQNAEDTAQKSAAIYEATEGLAGKFMEAWADSQFGDALQAAQAPTFLERAPQWFAYAFIGFVLIGVVSFAVFIVRKLGELFRLCVPPPKPRPDYAAWGIELKQAFALALKTDNFSEAACQTAAARNRESILSSHSQMEDEEAARVLTASERERHYEELAACVVPSSGLDKAAIVDTLRKADAWQYRTLQAAKKLALEGNHE